MKPVKATILALTALLTVAIAADAFAHGRGHRSSGHRSSVHFGFAFGAPAFWYAPPYYYQPYPYYYQPYPYYYPRTVVVPAAPTVYVEQGQPDPAPVQSAPAPASSYWYYCRESGAYYPYVNQCAGPWERVAPRPPS